MRAQNFIGLEMCVYLLNGHCCAYNFERKLFHCPYLIFGQKHRSITGALQGNFNFSVIIYS